MAIQRARNGSPCLVQHHSLPNAPAILASKMPFVHYTRAENATALLQQTLHRAKTPATADPLHIMDVHALRSLPLRDELRLHARYIRDTLVPLLSRQPRLTHSDTVLLQSIFKKLEATHVTLDLLRYSRIEKALMVIAVTGATTVRLGRVHRFDS